VTEPEGRALIVAEALTWQRTPWRHHACVKGVGVDCAHFVAGVYWTTGLVERFEIEPYPRDWHIHRDRERFLPVVLRFCDEIAEADAGPADVVLVRIGRVYSHGAILVAWPQVIHAWLPAGCVTLGDLDRDLDLADRPRRYFTFKGW
jgi:cell wall-associated NlpC family hydrolase